MTPLAHRIMKQSLLPKSKRTMVDECGLIGLMNDVHCFEVTEVYPLAYAALGDETFDFDAAKTYAQADEAKFLPAPNTWIEWEQDSPDGRIRTGHLIAEMERGIAVAVALERADGGPIVTGREIAMTEWGLNPADKRGHSGNEELLGTSIVLVAMINAPKVFGRRQHMPNARLERKLLARRGEIGKFPLHAWTEIKLEVTRPPENLSDGEIHEAHLTGQKAYHFCRAHLRIKNGRVEFVKAHWRGDPSLGIKRSRYTVTP